MSSGDGHGARHGGRGNKTTLAPHQVRRLRAMAADGYTLARAAKSLGISDKTLKPLAAALGVEFKATGRGGIE